MGSGNIGASAAGVLLGSSGVLSLLDVSRDRGNTTQHFITLQQVQQVEWKGCMEGENDKLGYFNVRYI